MCKAFEIGTKINLIGNNEQYQSLNFKYDMNRLLLVLNDMEVVYFAQGI